MLIESLCFRVYINVAHSLYVGLFAEKNEEPGPILNLTVDRSVYDYHQLNDACQTAFADK